MPRNPQPLQGLHLSDDLRDRFLDLIEGRDTASDLLTVRCGGLAGEWDDAALALRNRLSAAKFGTRRREA